MKRLSVVLLMVCLACIKFVNASDKPVNEKMEWFKSAKLGIFIHWGVYAVNGVSESWSFYNGQISYEDYLAQTKGFTAENYKPQEWAALIRESGAKYSVITSRHHDGFSLWNTQYGQLNALQQSAAKKDVLTPFVDALRKENLKVGIYYSLPDWSHADYTDYTRKIKRYKISEDPKRWKSYLKYMNGQLRELQTNYNPDLWWFDGDWEHEDDEWQVFKIKKSLLDFNPSCIINSRLRNKGDYATPELGVPVQRPESEYWELCQTMNDSWGYRPTDTNYKSSQEVVDILVDCISKGGNLLLDIGPKADGTIPAEQIKLLKELGRWVKKHTKAVYETEQGIPYEHFYGPSSLSKDRKTLYLYVRDIPRDNQIVLKGISNQFESIEVVGTSYKLKHKTYSKVSWNDYPGVTYITIPEEALDKNYTVLAVKFSGPIKLYTKVVGAIESN